MKALWNAFVSGAVKPEDQIAESAPLDAVPTWRSLPDGPPAATPPAAPPAEPEPPARAVAPPVEAEPASPPVAVPQGVLTFDRAGDIQAIDQAGAALFGYAPLELLGRRLQRIIPNGLPAEILNQEPVANGSQAHWIIGRTKGGSRFPLQCTQLPTNSDADSMTTVILRGTEDLEADAKAPALAHAWRLLEQELVETQRASQAVQSELSAAKDQNHRLQKTLDERTALAAEMTNSEVEAARAETANAEARRAQLTEQFEQLLQEKANAGARQADLENRLQAAMAKAAELEQALTSRGPAVEVQPDQALEAAQAELDEYRRRLDDQAASLNQARQTATELRGRVATLTGSFAELQAQLAISQEQARDHAEQAKGLAGELNFARERALRSQQETKSLAQAAEEAVKEAASLRVAMSALQQERDAWKTRGEQARTEADASVAAAARVERDAAGIMSRFQAMEQQLSEYRQLEAERRKTLESTQARFAEQTRTLSALQQSQADFDSERKRLLDELQQQTLLRTRAENESKALATTTSEVSREIAASRVVLSTLEHERDTWKARSQEARAEADAAALAAEKAERGRVEAEARCKDLEQQLTEHRQRETEWRQAADAAEIQFAERSKALAAVQREQESREAEYQRMATDLQQEVKRRIRAESEANASGETTTEISKELASARVVLETLRRERDLWQAQSEQARTDSNEAQTKLAAAEERQRQLEQATDSVCASLRRTLELTTTEMAPLVSSLQTALARHEEAKTRLTQTQADLDQAPSPYSIPHFHRDT